MNTDIVNKKHKSIKMLLTYSWNDLSNRMQNWVIDTMLEAFHKPWNSNIFQRFSKSHCHVDLFYYQGFLKGVCICWKWDINTIYLDKFFIREPGRGWGFQMLKEWIDTYGKYQLLWRTDSITQRFYQRHPDISTHFQHGNYFYMGNNQKRSWVYEDIWDLKVKPCF